jgi:hypothetical protein
MVCVHVILQEVFVEEALAAVGTDPDFALVVLDVGPVGQLVLVSPEE